MAFQMIFVFCEGPHDVAFITRILKTINFKSNDSTKISDFPFPFNKMIKNEVVKTDVEQLNLVEIRRNLLPASTLKDDRNLVFLYSLGGDSKREARIRILNDFKLLIPEEGEIVADRLPIGASISVLYFFDADNAGVGSRLNLINTEIQEVFPEILNGQFQNVGEVIDASGINVGNFIFTGPDNNTGKLEDILIPLMQQDNDDVFKEARNYLSIHFDDARLFPMKLAWENNTIVENRSTRARDKEKYDEKKSLIGVVGQLQRSGKSNVVCISDSDYITLSKINDCEKCNQIITFFRSVMI